MNNLTNGQPTYGVDDWAAGLGRLDRAPHVQLGKVDEACDACRARPVCPGQAVHQHVVSGRNGRLDERKHVVAELEHRLVAAVNERCPVGDAEVEVLQLALRRYGTGVGRVWDGCGMGVRGCEQALQEWKGP